MPTGPGGLDANGVWQYGEDDTEALASDLLNLGMASVSDVVAGITVLQVVSVTKTDTETTSSQTFANVAGLTASITPVSTSSKIFILVNAAFATNGATSVIYARLARDGTAIAIGDAAGDRPRTSIEVYGASSQYAPGAMSFEDSPASTATIVYSLQWRAQLVSPVYINRTSSDTDSVTGRSRAISTITVWEVAG